MALKHGKAGSSRHRAHAIAAMLLAAALAACGPYGRETILFVEDVAAGQAPTAFKAETPQPARREIVWADGDAERLADLYLPADGAPLARVVFIPGLSEDGKDDWRLVPMAETLARARFAVMVPDIVNIRRLRVSPQDAGEIASAIRWLSEQRLGPRGPQPVGIVGASYAAGPGFLATLQPGIADRVAFILTIGAYHDVVEALTYAITGFHRNDAGQWVQGVPTAFARWTFLRANAARLAGAGDRAALEAIGTARLADGATPIDHHVAALGPEGRAVWELFAATDPERLPALIAALPPALQQDILGLDLASRDLGPFRGQAILIHGAGDPAVPPSQSVALAEALGRRAHLYLLGDLNHAEFHGRPALADAIAMYFAGVRLMTLRDAIGEGRLSLPSP